MKKRNWIKLINNTNNNSARAGTFVYNKREQLCIKRPSLASCGYFYWVVPKKLLHLVRRNHAESSTPSIESR